MSSTIKSDNSDLTINADGSNEIKFQANGVEKASISSAGAFTSTTIDATALTGALPALDGSSLTGISAGADTSLSNLSSTGDAKVCKAWANFDGTGTPAFRDSHNCSSLTDNGVGKYSVNLTSAMSNTNYAMVVGHQQQDSAVSNEASLKVMVKQTSTSAFNYWTGYREGSAHGFADSNHCYVVVFGD